MRVSARRIGLLLLIIIQLVAFADQDPKCETHSGKAKRLYSKALALLNSGTKTARKEAYKLLIEATKIDKMYVDANFALGDINYQKSKVQIDPNRKLQLENRSITYFEKVLEVCPATHDVEVHYYIGEIHYSRHDFKAAREHLLAYQKDSKKKYFAEKNDKMLERVKIYFDLVNNPVDFKPTKLEGISTDDDEFLPIISPDGGISIYTHRYIYEDPLTKKTALIDELSVSTRSNNVKDLNEVFSKGKKMPYPFNEKGLNQGAMSITIDNNELYITICKEARSSKGPFMNCDIYVSHKKHGDWTELKNLGPQINGKYSWESQPSISADGTRLYFSSIRPSNIGWDYSNNQTADIYVSEKDKNGVWKKAKNIGPAINTSGNEKSPFLHTDSRTLYFSSDGLPGLGGYDIYYAKESDKGWETPINIGYPINKESDDQGFFVSTNGKKAYFSSNEFGDSKRFNIYSFNLYEKARPEKVFFAKGKLLDEKGDVLTDAKVEIKTSSSEKVQKGMVNKETGEYAIAVSVEKDEEVLLTVKKEGHAFSSKYIKASITETEAPKEITMEVQKVKVGATVKINDIHFATASDMFMQGSIFILNNFVDYLQENPKIKIEIHGHTDNVGSLRLNKKLSLERAKTIRDFLVFQGIAQDRIIAYKGFGEANPVASNSTEKGRAKNRRTEFLIVAN